MFPPFPEKPALQILRNVVYELKNGSLCLEQTGKISEERNGQGIMIGSLVASDEQGNFFILKTNSGISKQLKRVFPSDQGFLPDILKSFDHFTSDSIVEEIFVDPVVPAEKINQALSKNDLEIHRITEKLNSRQVENLSEEEKKLLSARRTGLCNESLLGVYDLYSFHCADGYSRKLMEICPGKLPPTGTGDCCAPKLLDYAFSRKLTPLSMAEIFFQPGTECTFENVPPCDERCGLILPEMLGLNIVYRDENILVVNKQSGLLSVPGRGPEKQDCIVNRMKKLFPHTIMQPSVHRLDMETSGLMVLAFDEETHRNLNRQFENREVKKEYTAVLEGIILKKDFEENSRIRWYDEKRGIMELYFRLDVENRPHQIWDEENGKLSVTEFEILNYENYKDPQGKIKKSTRVRFIPHTGRTHQLRLASADIHGFGHQIIGDTLYGTCLPGERLLLHSHFLSFDHPGTGSVMEFNLPAEF